MKSEQSPTEINWAEPPADALTLGGKCKIYGRSQFFADELKSHPGQWAYYGMKARGSAEYLMREYGLEVKIEKVTSSQCNVYARWNEAA